MVSHQKLSSFLDKILCQATYQAIYYSQFYLLSLRCKAKQCEHFENLKGCKDRYRVLLRAVKFSVITGICEKISHVVSSVADTDSDPIGSGSSNLKTDHKLKHLVYLMNFFQICLQFFPIFSSLLKEFLHNQKKI